MIGNATIYKLDPESAIDQFRYWVTTNLHNHEIMLKFFNLVNENKLAKEGNKIILDSIRTNMKLVVPMLTSQFTLAESKTYDSLTDAKFQQIVAQAREEIGTLSNFSTNYREGQFDSSTHVKIRLLHNQRVGLTHPQNHAYAIIHFHGGGFVC